VKKDTHDGKEEKNLNKQCKERAPLGNHGKEYNNTYKTSKNKCHSDMTCGGGGFGGPS
jgi:hypothetical protein